MIGLFRVSRGFTTPAGAPFEEIEKTLYIATMATKKEPSIYAVLGSNNAYSAHRATTGLQEELRIC